MNENIKTKLNVYTYQKVLNKYYDVYIKNPHRHLFRTTLKPKTYYKNYLIFTSDKNILFLNEKYFDSSIKQNEDKEKEESFLIKKVQNDFKFEKINSHKAFKILLSPNPLFINQRNKKRRLKIEIFGDKFILEKKMIYDFEGQKIKLNSKKIIKGNVLNTKLIETDDGRLFTEKKEITEHLKEIKKIEKEFDYEEIGLFYLFIGKLTKRSILLKALKGDIHEYIKRKISEIFFGKQKKIDALCNFLNLEGMKKKVLDFTENTPHFSFYKNLFLLIEYSKKKERRASESQYDEIYEEIISGMKKYYIKPSFKASKKEYKEIFKNNLKRKFIEKFLESFKRRKENGQISFLKPFRLMNYLPNNKHIEICKEMLSDPLNNEVANLLKVRNVSLHNYDYEDHLVNKRKQEEIFQLTAASAVGKSLFYFCTHKARNEKCFVKNIENNEMKVPEFEEYSHEIKTKFQFSIQASDFLSEKINKNVLYRHSPIFNAIMQGPTSSDYAGLIYAYGLKGILHESFNRTEELSMILKEESFFANIFLVSFCISIYEQELPFDTEILFKYAIQYSSNTNYDRRMAGIQSLSFLISKIEDPIKKEYMLKILKKETEKKGSFNKIMTKEQNLLGNKIARKSYFTAFYNLNCVFSLAFANLGSKKYIKLNSELAECIVNGINFHASGRTDIIKKIKEIEKGGIFTEYQTTRHKKMAWCTSEYQFYFTLLTNLISYEKTIEEALFELETFSEFDDLHVNLFYFQAAQALFVGLKCLKEDCFSLYERRLVDLALKLENRLTNIHFKKVLAFVLLGIVLNSKPSTEIMRIIRRRIKLCSINPKPQSHIITTVKDIKRITNNIFPENSNFGEIEFYFTLLGFYMRNLGTPVKMEVNTLFIFTLLNSFPIIWHATNNENFYLNKFFIFLNPKLFNLQNEKKLVVIEANRRIINCDLNPSFSTFQVGRNIFSRYVVSSFYEKNSPIKRKIVIDILIDYFKNNEIDEDLEDFKEEMLNCIFKGVV